MEAYTWQQKRCIFGKDIVHPERKDIHHPESKDIVHPERKDITHLKGIAILQHLLKENVCVCGDLFDDWACTGTISERLKELKNFGFDPEKY